MLLKQLSNCISSWVGWHIWIVKQLGQTNERKSVLAMGKDCDDEECEDFEYDQAEEAGSAAGQ